MTNLKTIIDNEVLTIAYYIAKYDDLKISNNDISRHYLNMSTSTFHLTIKKFKTIEGSENLKPTKKEIATFEKYNEISKDELYNEVQNILSKYEYKAKQRIVKSKNKEANSKVNELNLIEQKRFEAKIEMLKLKAKLKK